ncbi:MAG: acyl-CoA dehydrogenase family protein, partial [Streptomyces sp.]|nr:acyl-CoA dehydrogenase family protein [Streptomyces sp.]
MRFQLTVEQRALRDAVRAAVGRWASAGSWGLVAQFPAPLRGVAEPGIGQFRLDRGLWRALGDLGFFSLRLPEADGGAGLGLPEAVLVFEEAGRALVPGPLLATHLAAGVVPGAQSGEVVVAGADGRLVEWMDEADVVLPGAEGAVPLKSVDPLTPLHRVPAPAPTDWVAVLLTAAEQLGTATRACELAVQHARTRE